MAVEIDEAKLKALMRLKPTLADTAAFFECSTRTIDRYIHEKWDIPFKEFRERHMVHTRHDLIRKAIDMALSGNVSMLIFTLKNLCGWKDRPEEGDDGEPKPSAGVTLTDEQLQKLVKAARGAKNA